MIYSLRTKILGQLRALGFVKGRGPMNIRFLNSNSNNFSLVKAAICGGQPLDHFAWIKEMNCKRCLGLNSDEVIYVDPKSVINFPENDKNLPVNLILFDRKINCGQLFYLQNCTIINPLTMAIFMDESISEPAKYHNNCIELNNYFHLTGPDMEMLFNIRKKWKHFERKRLFNIQQMISEEDMEFLNDLGHFITSSDELIGFHQHQNIGRAPQVMSTNFCSPVTLKK